MKSLHLIAFGAVVALLGSPAPSFAGAGAFEWQQEFNLAHRMLESRGSNPFFILEPGFELVFESKNEKLVITVLDETAKIDGVTTRVVDEHEWKHGELVEVSRNFFAIDPATKDVFYFGEEVDDVQSGKVTGHDGSWQAGKSDAKAGLAMPGTPTDGMKFLMEIAPGVAMDRAEILSTDAKLKTPAGLFKHCLKTQEGSALDPSEKEFKFYAPGIGLIKDGDVLLVKHGFTKK